jgi:hypothetical protein
MSKTFDFPTEVIELPSKGLVYPTDHPLSSGTIEIKHMTAREEDLLSSPNLVKKGIVLDKLFETIIVSDVDPNDIIAGDKNAILYSTRILAYGAPYTFKFYSSVTDSVVEHTINLTDLKYKQIDYSLFDNKNEFNFTLPHSGKMVKFKLLTHKDELVMDKELRAMTKVDKDTSFAVTTRMRHSILSVDGDTNTATITKFVNNMSPKDARAFREYLRDITPDIDTMVTYVHEDDTEEEVRVAINTSFFWPTT